MAIASKTAMQLYTCLLCYTYYHCSILQMFYVFYKILGSVFIHVHVSVSVKSMYMLYISVIQIPSSSISHQLCHNIRLWCIGEWPFNTGWVGGGHENLVCDTEKKVTMNKIKLLCW